MHFDYFDSKVINAGLALVALLSACPLAWAGTKEEVAAVGSAWGKALGEDDPDRVLPLYADDAVLWGTLSPTGTRRSGCIEGLFCNGF